MATPTSNSLLNSFRHSSSRFSFRINSLSNNSNFSSSIPSSANPLLQLLDSRLTDQLNDLNLDRDEETDDDKENCSTYLSAKWLIRAMDVAISANSNVKAFLPDLQRDFVSSSSSYHLKERMEDNVRLLDVCKALQVAVSSLKARHNLARLVSQILNVSASSQSSSCSSLQSLRRAKHAIAEYRKLSSSSSSSCTKKMRTNDLVTRGAVVKKMGEKLHHHVVNDSDSSNSKGMTHAAMGAMYASHIITIIMCGFLICALDIHGHGHDVGRHPMKGSFSSMLLCIPIAKHSRWSIELSDLQRQVRDQVERQRANIHRTPYLEELENVDTLLGLLETSIEDAIGGKCTCIVTGAIAGGLCTTFSHDTTCTTSIGIYPSDMHASTPCANAPNDMYISSLGNTCTLNSSSGSCMAGIARSSILRLVSDLAKFVDALEVGLSQIEQHISELYQVLITIRMMLLEFSYKSTPFP